MEMPKYFTGLITQKSFIVVALFSVILILYKFFDVSKMNPSAIIYNQIVSHFNDIHNQNNYYYNFQNFTRLVNFAYNINQLFFNYN